LRVSIVTKATQRRSKQPKNPAGFLTRHQSRVEDYAYPYLDVAARHLALQPPLERQQQGVHSTTTYTLTPMLLQQTQPSMKSLVMTSDDFIEGQVCRSNIQVRVRRSAVYIAKPR
jgi:hypothetical protein